MRWKTKSKEEWHRHFAWRPIKIDGEHVWFEWVMRRGREMSGYENKKKQIWRWEYVNSLLDIIAMDTSHRSKELAQVGMNQQGPIAKAGLIMTKKQEDADIYLKMISRQKLSAMNPEE